MLCFFIRKRINLTLDSEVLTRAKNKGSRNENVELDEWILKKGKIRNIHNRKKIGVVCIRRRARRRLIEV